MSEKDSYIGLQLFTHLLSNECSLVESTGKTISAMNAFVRSKNRGQSELPVEKTVQKSRTNVQNQRHLKRSV